MKAPAYLAVFIGIALLGFGAYMWQEKSEKTEVSSYLDERQQLVDQVPTTTEGSSTTPATVTDEKTYSMADIAQHPDKNSCWSTVNGIVYDLTAWIPRHPGGPARIISMCGKDATERFTDQHGGDQRPEKMLATFKIGVLVQ